MVRHADRLTARTFDVLIVGGGIYGLTIAYDAAQRGLSVALIERDDFGSGSSFNHLRTIHGGLRYLQTLDLRRARESVRERATLARIAPHAVRPMPFVLPLSRSLTTGTTAMRLGFLLDRLVAFDRNAGVTGALQLPAGCVLSREEAARRFPALRPRGLTGAAMWYDYVSLESDRLTYAFAIAADRYGAVLTNYVEATTLLTDGKRVTGVRARDRQSGRDLDIAARLTVNATGAAIDRLLVPLGVSTSMPLVTAMNLVTDRAAGEEALGGRVRSGRTLFLVPWRGRVLAGTWESPRTAGPGPPVVSGDDIVSFIADINEAFPALSLTPEDVTLVHRGVVPAARTPAGGLRLEGHEQIRDHVVDGFEGLLSVAGTKYTTARAVAERIVDRALAKLSRSPVLGRTATTPLTAPTVGQSITADSRRGDDSGTPAGMRPSGNTEAGLSIGTEEHLLAAYGSQVHHLLDLAVRNPTWRAPVAESSPVIGAELVWAVRHEMVVTLADAVIRRTPLGALGCPSDAALAAAAAIVGTECEWSEQRRREEIADVRRFYAPSR